ncbi:type III restriction endonuclease subunit R [Lampropedia puyangensis]|uniref:Type III restriction endonuclease subunit R n=1 Tax=Lampropedia puyangensis TaxID=1330072 RepID=A0A4S8EYB2_9BURK|nr:DEAD/DEAH box helicase family protein [Lampropedia puyangensis]THT97711.1 type III restriction endonuclease subunit R [Lampropedia puyangensis]
MTTRIKNAVTGRLSLRAPQAESLAKLVQAIDAAPSLLEHGDRDIEAILNTLKAEFPTLQAFERDFPSLCFALATGVGKTRLMGAFVAYLHLQHGINNFFVLAPNLTIYNKLIDDFTPNTPKYVFKGIAEFAQQAPLIITGDNYDQSGAAVNDLQDGFEQDVRINIFNISKINSEVRGGKEPRIKRMREVLGDSYFNHLANLPDLVLLMDESHRYRASAGIRAINELQPLFGLELTATPFTESNKGPVPFQNVVMDYPLARALEDGFVKDPAVVTQRNFKASDHTPEEVEKIKLEDGIRLHEETKVELITYARDNGVKTVKPFMLVIARDTTHASQLLDLLQSESFYEGRYAGKVIQVDSSQTGEKEEEMIRRLLAVESVDEPTEIVVHVNMLKEGWDVTNLYTIVPLRAANARTLIEQSIGRGLRLPYGKRTGVEPVDRLNIVAHDRFQEVVDDANKADSPIKLKQVILEAPSQEEKKVSVTVEPSINAQLGLTPSAVHKTDADGNINVADAANVVKAPSPVFTNEADKKIAQATLAVIRSLSTKATELPQSASLQTPEAQQKIVSQVKEKLKEISGDLLTGVDEQAAVPDVAAVVAKTTEIVVQKTIDIPRITVVPTGEVKAGFRAFELNTSQLNLQPGSREIVGQVLRTGEQFTLESKAGLKEARPEDYIVHRLVDFDDVDYFTQADLLYELAGQMVTHLRSYLPEEDVENVLNGQRATIAKEIHSQMKLHFFEESSGESEVVVHQGFTPLKPCNYTAAADKAPQNYRQTVQNLSKIRTMLFTGFSKCLYELQRFDSDTERRFAVLLERDALKWFKPAKGQFQIYYKQGNDHAEYIPDFVVELDDAIYMAETKASGDVNLPEVQAKATAASLWCKHASDYTKTVGGKPWHYLLIPHDDVVESNTLKSFLKFEKRT